MIVAKTFSAVCRGCNQPITLREYCGLPGGLYGSHSCAAQADRERLYALPDSEDWFSDLKEVPNGGTE